jgi:hypothetical protein
MKADPQKEHQWLQRFVGEWKTEGEAPTEPGKPPAKWWAIETVRSIGGHWVVCEGRGEMPGGGASTTIMTLGYDSQKKRYVGTWVGSMMSHMWVYDGAVDASGKVLTLDTVGPTFSGDGQMTKYQDIIEFKSDDHRILTARVLGPDGKWSEMMTADYRRTK